MKRATAIPATDEWTIYNCHIHTFTRKHTPRYFLKWVLASGELGRINWMRITLSLLILMLYVGFFLLMANLTISLSQRSGLWFLLGDTIAQVLQTVLSVLIILIFVLFFLSFSAILRLMIDLLRRLRPESASMERDRHLTQVAKQVSQGQRGVIRLRLLEPLARINPASTEGFERLLSFLKIAHEVSQEDVFRQVALEYPRDTTVFVVLPMDLTFMNLGTLETSIERQHEELLKLAQTYDPQIIPFYAADPRHTDIVERVRENLAPGKFRGISLYPNLGYRPDHPKLMEVYNLCLKGGYPVVTHCSMGGLWRYGLTKRERRANSGPLNYKQILDTKEYNGLKLCLTHFGGLEEWAKHLKGRDRWQEEKGWGQTIYDMIASGEYPNLYADISDMVFTSGAAGLSIEPVDYLKVLLTHPRVRQRVLFGSDYYLAERENMSEKEASLLLRSRLGEDLYKQIAYTNPREFLGIEAPTPRLPA